jgi:DegV family protein with EDD domain
MTFKIVSDSAVDIKSIQGIPFESVPLKIMTDAREYVDNESLDVVGMLSDLKAYKGKSHTSCPSTGEYAQAFGDAENVFCVTITSNLSGSYNSACVAARSYMEEHPDRNVHIIDSLSTGPENALQVEKLRELILADKSFEEIKSEINDYSVNHTRLIFALESMRNLANNGRVKPVIAKMAELFGIRAIGRASDIGTLEMICKSRGPKNAAKDILDNMIGDGYKGGRVKLHHANNLSAAQLLQEKILEKFPNAQIEIGMTGGLCSFYAEQGGLLVGFEI